MSYARSQSSRISGRNGRPMYKHRSRSGAAKPFIGFLMIACFGILFAGCGKQSDRPDFVFTQDDVAKFRELADDAQVAATASGVLTGSGGVPYLEALPSGSGTLKGNPDDVVLDLSQLPTYKAMRTGQSGTNNYFQVTNAFLNVRSDTSANAANIARLENGASVEVIEFPRADWAKIKMTDGKEGFVASRYIAKMTTNEKIADEQKKYEGLMYVNFAFVNMRASADQKSEKIGEIPGQAIIKPSSSANGWSKVTYGGKEGYVSSGYLKPFLPTFVVRQDSYTLPILMYNVGADTTVLKSLSDQVTRLKQEGYSLFTLRQFYDVLLQQQQRNTVFEGKNVVIGLTGVTADNLKDVSATLNANGINATLFLETKDVGLTGITEKQIITMQANGFDIQSATHSGDDLRALTNAQVQLEMKQSRKILEDLTKRTIFAVAYPDGGTNDRVAELAAEAGYLLGVSGNSGTSFRREQFLRLPSIQVFPSTSADEIMHSVTGQ